MLAPQQRLSTTFSTRNCFMGIICILCKCRQSVRSDAHDLTHPSPLGVDSTITNFLLPFHRSLVFGGQEHDPCYNTIRLFF